MLKPEHRAIVREQLSDSCVRLFEAYGVNLVADPPGMAAELDDLSMVGVIGFTSNQMRGTLVLAATDAPLTASNRVMAPARDWIAELSNQLLGRFKNRLLSFGVDLQMSTPLSLRGSQLRLVTTERALEPDIFISPNGKVAVWLDVEASPDLVLAAPVGAPEVASEGDTLLF